MRNVSLWWPLVLVLCASGLGTRGEAGQSSNAEQYAGNWSGTWDGSGEGKFELMLAASKDGAVTGKVAVTTDGGNYTADLKDVAFEGDKMTAKYDFPLDPSAEVVVAATFETSAAKGTWSLRPKGQSTEIAGGMFALKK